MIEIYFLQKSKKSFKMDVTSLCLVGKIQEVYNSIKRKNIPTFFKKIITKYNL